MNIDSADSNTYDDDMNGADMDGAVAIIGMGLRAPGADSPEAFWRNLRNGVCSISTFTPAELRAAGIPEATFSRPDYVPAGGVLANIDQFDAGFFGFTAREAQCLAPQNRLLFEVCWEALEYAGYDPKGTPGRTGLFFGQSLNSYWQNNVEPNLTALDVGLDFFANPDFLSTGIAYKLDLRGPALTVQSFCSTSLLAVHLARQSLLEGECDMALAGGTSVRVPQTQGYVHMVDSLYSPDGVIRAFDAGANGTLFSNAVGAVLLKRLEDALADGDRIDAVIRGSAANNDGNRKAGYNSPSIDGQARAVTQALRDAGVSADSIGYVECHGTGTLMGDPIEIAALAKAFRGSTDRRGYCAIGSVKPNIGHADRASGVLGLIKAALCLRHRMLPGLLNYETPNPQIDLATSPFYISAHGKPWDAADGPRRAGVTSLGYGGTNVHVVLEEAPPARPGAERAQAHPIVLSARTASALDAAAQRLADHLERHPDLPLDAVAYTLQAGRHGFNHRRLVVGDSVAEIARQLREPAPDSVTTLRNPPVHFVFSEAPLDRAAARAVYRDNPTLRRLLDEDGAMTFDAALDKLSDAACRLLFDQALARTWMDWGIKPASLRGHGVGRLTAACVAGTIGLDAALSQIAAGDIDVDRDKGAVPVASLDDIIDPAEIRLDIGLDNLQGKASLAATLGELWRRGVAPDWQAVQNGDVPPRLALPTYAFDRQHHWLDGRQEQAVDEHQPKPAATGPAVRDDLPPTFSVPSWKRLPPGSVLADAPRCRMVILDRAGLGEQLATTLERHGDTIIRITAGTGTANPASRCYAVDTARPEQMDQLLNRLKIWAPTSLILCSDPMGANITERALAGFQDLQRWIRAVNGVWPEKPFAIQTLATGMFQVTGADLVRPEFAGLAALSTVAVQEHPHLACRVIDTGAGVSVDALATELRLPDTLDAPAIVALRGNQRWAPVIEPMNLETQDAAPGMLEGVLQQHGVYLITGGLGGIGQTLAGYLARKVAARLVLVSRQIPTPGETGGKARRLAALREQGAEVLAIAADAADPAQLAEAIAQTRAHFGHIDGVIHAAGLPGAVMIDSLTAEQIAAVMAPKIAGACALFDLLRDDPPSFMMFCSSLAAVLPTVGQAHYAAANAVLDALAQRTDNPMPVISVNWNSWRSIGMAQDLWNRQAIVTAVEHPVFFEKSRMPDGEVRYRGQLDPGRDWLLAEHRLFNRPTLPGTGLIELVLSALAQEQDGFQPVELRDVALTTPLSLDEGQSVEIRVSLTPTTDGTYFKFDSIESDATPRLHGEGLLRQLDAGRVNPVIITAAANTPSLSVQVSPDLYLGSRWQSLIRLTSDAGRSVAELSLPQRFHGDIATAILHPALLDIATSIHGQSLDGLHLPIGYRRLRVHAPLTPDLVSAAHLPADDKNGSVSIDMVLADCQGRVLVEIDGYTLMPVAPAGGGSRVSGSAAAHAVDRSHGISFEADSITPEEGVAIFRKLPIGIVPQLMISRPRSTVPVVTDATTGAALPVERDLRKNLGALWQRILGGSVPAVDANFFELGGNSLGATRILSSIRETYGVKLDIKSFFADATIEALARRVEAALPTQITQDDEEMETGTL